jgi:hypothetical protein
MTHQIKPWVTAVVLMGVVLPLNSLTVSGATAQTKSACQTTLESIGILATKSAEVAKSFTGEKCTLVKLTTATTFYRHYSDEAKKSGIYLSTTKYTTNVDAIKKLALQQDWGNKATKVASVTLPTGTATVQGTAAPQAPSTCYPGGGQQTVISNPDSFTWSAGQNLTVQTFTCP